MEGPANCKCTGAFQVDWTSFISKILFESLIKALQLNTMPLARNATIAQDFPFVSIEQMLCKHAVQLSSKKRIIKKVGACTVVRGDGDITAQK